MSGPIFTAARLAIGRIYVDSTPLGTCVLISEDAVVTCQHVVQGVDPNRLEIRFEQSRSAVLAAEFSFNGPGDIPDAEDLAVLSLACKVDAVPLQWTDTRLAVGVPVSILGYPNDPPEATLEICETNTSSIRERDGLLQVADGQAVGQSGGAVLFDVSGIPVAAGLLVSRRQPGTAFDPVRGWIIPADRVRSLAQRLRRNIPLSTTSIDRAGTQIGALVSGCRYLLSLAPTLDVLASVSTSAGPELAAARSWLASQPRRIASGTTSTTLDDVLSRPERLNLLVGSGGLGKSHALRDLTERMLADGRPALFLDVSGHDSAQSVLELLNAVLVSSALGQLDLIVLDGWSHFPSTADGALVERTKLLSVFRAGTIIATARSASGEVIFKQWVLEPLSTNVIDGFLERALPSQKVPRDSINTLLRLPLVLLLYARQGGTDSTRGSLIRRFHESIAERTTSQHTQLTDAMCSAAAAAELSAHAKVGDVFRDAFVRFASARDLERPLELMSQLGTIVFADGRLSTIHDLYWSWLVGRGLLAEKGLLSKEILGDRAVDEALQIALEAGSLPDNESIVATASVDRALAASLLRDRDHVDAAGEFRRLVKADLAARDDFVRLRSGVIAALRSAMPDLIQEALLGLAHLRAMDLYVHEFDDVLDPEVLWKNRDQLRPWMPNTDARDRVLDAIAKSGGPRWTAFLHEEYVAARLSAEEAASAALACVNNIPDWVRPLLPKLVAESPWKLRYAYERGENEELAEWVAGNYELYDSRGGSGWCDLNRVLLRCGEDSAFEILLNRFESLPENSQEWICYAVVEKGEPWLSRLQEKAFVDGHRGHLHKLRDRVGTLVTDIVIESWLSSDSDKLQILGWRGLVRRRQQDAVHRVVASLPASFSGLHVIPPLIGLAELEDGSKTLVQEIWSRVNGTMEPQAMQDVLLALAAAKPFGIASVFSELRYRLELLPAFHMALFLRLAKEWEHRHNLRVMARTAQGGRPFVDAIVSSWFGRLDETSAGGVVCAGWHEELSDELLAKWPNRGNEVLRAFDVAPQFSKYHPALVERLMSCGDQGRRIVLQGFKSCFNTFPENVLRTVVGADAAMALSSLASSPSVAHLALHKEFLEQTMTSQGLDEWRYRYMAQILAVHPVPVLREIFESRLSDHRIRWLVREISLKLRRRLADDSGRWIA